MNKEPNILIKFWDFLTLKTYHKNLLTSGGSTYLTVISFIMVIPPFLIELMGRKSKALLLFKNRWTTIY